MRKIIQVIKVELYKEIESLSKSPNWNKYRNEKFTNRKIGMEDRIKVCTIRYKKWISQSKKI